MSTPDGTPQSPDEVPHEQYVQPEPPETPSFTAPGAPAPQAPGHASVPPGQHPPTVPGYGPPPGYGPVPGGYGPPQGPYGPPQGPYAPPPGMYGPGAYPYPHPSAYMQPKSSLHGGLVGAGVAIGFGAILLIWIVLPLFLTYMSGVVLMVMAGVPVAGGIMCFFRTTRSIGLGMLIAGATFFVTAIGPCFVLFTAV